MTTEEEKEAFRQRFINDVKDHELTIVSDDGKGCRYLHIRNPKEFYYWYEISTWGESLCITGDMGTFVFRRCADMFRFFRRDDLNINVGYWHEKMQADSTYRKAMQFDEDALHDALREAVQDDLDDEYRDDEEREEALEELADFLSGLEGNDEGYQIREIFDYKSAKYYDHLVVGHYQKASTQFKWCLYAIVHAIHLYDKAMETDQLFEIAEAAMEGKGQ